MQFNHIYIMNFIAQAFPCQEQLTLVLIFELDIAVQGSEQPVSTAEIKASVILEPRSPGSKLMAEKLSLGIPVFRHEKIGNFALAKEKAVNKGLTVAQEQAELIIRKCHKISTITAVVAGTVILITVEAAAITQNMVEVAKPEIALADTSWKATSAKAFFPAAQQLKTINKLSAKQSYTQVATFFQEGVDRQKRNIVIEHTSAVTSVIFSPDGKIIASASLDSTIKLWKPDATHNATMRHHHDGVTSIAFSPDGRTLASGSSDKTIKLWTDKGFLMGVSTLTGHTDRVTSVAFSPDGQIVASGSWDKTIKLWKRDGTLITTLTGHQRQVTSVTFSPDGQIVASGSWDKTIKLWKRDGTPITTLTRHTHPVTSVVFSPDGQTLASASSDKTIKLWNFF